MRFASRLFIACVMAACLVSTVSVAGTYDLAADWSDLSNPNGVWSYNGSPGTPITTHWDDWDPLECCVHAPQPAWAAAPRPNQGHVPMWAKIISEAVEDPIVPDLDWPIGRVVMHGAEGYDPPARAGVTWTSPIDGVIIISGGVWTGMLKASRSMDWTIYLNDTPLTTGSLSLGNPYSSIAPFDFADGSGGPDVLTQAVSVGDVVTLEFVKTSPFATVVGIDLQILTSITVGIDVKPGSDPNCFNNNGHGVIPVAILGSTDFDVTSIDQLSLTLDGFTVRVRGNKGPLCSVEFSNDDSFSDLVCHFEDEAPDNWINGDASAVLTGLLLDGTAIEGTDSICVVP